MSLSMEKKRITFFFNNRIKHTKMRAQNNEFVFNFFFLHKQKKTKQEKV